MLVSIPVVTVKSLLFEIMAVSHLIDVPKFFVTDAYRTHAMQCSDDSRWKYMQLIALF